MIAPLYDLIYVFPICQILILIAGPYVGIPERSVLGCIVSCIVICFIQMLRYFNVRGKFITLGVSFALFIGVYFAIGKEKFYFCVDKYSWISICILISLGAYIIGVLAANKKLIRRIVGIGIFGVAIYLMVVKEPIIKFAAVMIFLILLIWLAQEVQEKWEKSGYTMIKVHMVMLFPILIVLCIFVMFTNAPDKPYDWKFARLTWDNISLGFDRFVEWVSKPAETYGDIGFAGDSSFLANLNDSDKDAMRIKMYGENPSFIYLAGKTFDDFSGKGWQIKIEDSGNFRMMDALELREAVIKYDGENEKNYIIKTKNDIENLMKSTRFIFLPSKTILDAIAFSDIKYTERACDVKANDKIRNGDSYKFVYYKLNMTNPKMLEILDYAKPISQEEWESAVRRELHKQRSEFSYEEYQKYHDWIYSNYCDTDVASESVKSLLREIIEDADSAYGKMQAIEDYLRDFTYSVSLDELPVSVVDSKTYLDYFMLQSKEGYCVHFATAFVLLARECGMPARYVQGYRIGKSNMEYVDIKESYSHAWPEVYFDNVGWIAFEPTPGYSKFGGWKVSDEQDVDADNVDKKDNKEIKQDQNNTTESDNDHEDEIIKSNETFVDILARIYANLRFIVIPLCAVIAFLCLYIALSRIISRHKYMLLDNEEKIKNLAARNLKILRYLGYELSQYETLTEYRERLLETVENDIADNLEFIKIYESIIYADKTVDSDMLKKFEASHSILKIVLCDKKKIYKLFNW